MKWKNMTFMFLGAVLLVLSACGSKEEGPRISDLTKPAVEEPAQTEQEPATEKSSAVKIEKNKTEKDEDGEAEKQAQTEALLAAYEAILDRCAEALVSGGGVGTGDMDMTFLEEAYWNGDGVGYAIEDLNGDGVPELILGPRDGSTLGALYTGDGSEPVLLLQGWYRNRWLYLGDGRFYNSGSAGAAYAIAGTYALSRNTPELICEDFYFTYELDENFEEIGFFHNTSGLWDTSVSEQTDMTYEDLGALEQEWSAQVQPLDLTPLEVSISGSQVRVMWAGEEWDGDYELVDISTNEPTSTILLVADSPVVDVQFLSLFLEDVADDGTVTFSSSVLFGQDVLTPECGIAVVLTIYGDLPNYGISYIDANGEFWRFAIEISGYDGSIILTEF